MNKMRGKENVMDKFVKVGVRCIKSDHVSVFNPQPDGTVHLYMVGCEHPWEYVGQDAADLANLFANVRQACEIVADREMDQAPGYGELLQLVKDAAEIIKAYADAWVGHVDNSDTGEWLARASRELGGRCDHIFYINPM